MSEKLNLPKRSKTSYTEQVARSISWGHYFIFLNIILLCIECSAYIYSAPSIDGFTAFFYLLLSWIGHSFFLSVVCYLVIFFPLAFIGNFRYYRVLSVIIAVLLHTVLLFDIKLYMAIRVHLGITAINLMVSGFDLHTGLNYNFLMPAVLLLIGFELFFAKITTHSLYKEHHPVFVRSVFICFISCFVASHIIHIWSDAFKYEPVTSLRTTLPAHYPMTAKSFLNAHGWLSEDSFAESDTGGSRLNYPPEQIESEPSEHPADIIIISFNALSSADLSEKVTPYLLKLKGRSQSFENHYLLYEKDNDNIFGAFYSLPLQYRSEIFRQGIPSVMTSEMLLQDYTVRVISSFPGYSSEQKERSNLLTAAHSGFRAVHTIKAADASEAFAAAAKLKEQKERPLFLTVLINDTAAVKESCDAFIKRAEQRKAEEEALSAVGENSNENIPADQLSDMKEDLTVSADPATIYEDLHECALRGSDELLGSFIKQLKDSGSLDNTLLIITSHAGNPALADRSSVYDRRMQKVPLLLFRHDGSARGSVVNVLSSSADIAPTVTTEILHIKTPLNLYAGGRSLYALPDREYLISDGADSILLIGKDRLMIFSQDGDSYIESDDRRLRVKPDLEDLIRSTREINRFLK